MRVKSPSAFGASLLIHALVAAVVFFTTVFVAQQQKPPVIFELVAGPPTAPEQLVAPALGNTTAPIKLDVPQVNLPPDIPQPVTPPAPDPTPVKPVEPAAKPEPVKREAVKPVPSKAKPEPSIAKQIKAKERVSYRQYLKAHPTPKPVAPSKGSRATNVPRIDAQGIANGVRGGSRENTKGGGGGKVLSREERDELDTYITFLLQALKEAHEPPPGVSDQLEAKVTFEITASGRILNPRISHSSGNREFDESVLAAFRKVRPIGPPPDGKSDTWTVGFKMKDEG